MTAGVGFAVKERFQGICDIGRVSNEVDVNRGGVGQRPLKWPRFYAGERHVYRG